MDREQKNWKCYFKTGKPAILFFWIFALSCRVLSATQFSTCQKCSSKQDTTNCQNMSVYHLAEVFEQTGHKHGSGPPEAFSEIKPAKTCLQTACQKCLSQQDTKHAKSCQDTTCQTYMNKQASNMAAYLLKQSQKLVTATAHAQTSHMQSSAPLEAFSAPNMPNHVRIPPVKHI